MPDDLASTDEADRIAGALREAICDGGLPRDGRLPSEREMAERFGVSRARLRRALDLLEAEGTVFRRRGQGTFVLPPPATDASRLAQIARQVTPRHVMEVRLEIEPALAALAAERAERADLKRLEHLMRATLDPADMAGYEVADDIFHYKIAELARNPLFLTVYESIRSVRRQADWTRQRRESYSAETMARLGRQHQELAAAIAARDSRGAAEAMELHLLTVSKALLRDRHRGRPV